ncbi:MAG TPA: hypothetical protein PK752_00530 [Accumulibacter sp.]|uniref:hypothetical protein n=1 Tax=Accumulibacter sp. TaxID=2053492 RepID=UPI002CCF38CB|nr:hypothetical protein [Accumulibacter sp.]HRD86732.1 hypothetical protein [Accumulibacter sp.]
MHLSKHDLFQMNDEWLTKPPPQLLLQVSKRLSHDVKELQDRLNQNPPNSSCPPTSQAIWAKTGGSEEQGGAVEERVTPDAVAETAGSLAAETEQAPLADGQRPSCRKGSGKPPGRQPGSAGRGRRCQKVAITELREHRPGISAACGAALPAGATSQACTAWDEVDMAPRGEGLIGLRFRFTAHRLLEVCCFYVHVGRARPWRAPADGRWRKVELQEWRLVGPRLAAVIGKRRSRSWPHRMRKLGGLHESSDAGVAAVGPEMQGIMKELRAAICAARSDSPPERLPALHAKMIERLRHLYKVHRMDAHLVLRRVVREVLRDGNGILRTLAECHLPLADDGAEQVLRQWVISRHISRGTRSEWGFPCRPFSSPDSPKPAPVAAHPPGSTSAPSSPPVAEASSSPRSPPSRQP